MLILTPVPLEKLDDLLKGDALLYAQLISILPDLRPAEVISALTERKVGTIPYPRAIERVGIPPRRTGGSFVRALINGTRCARIGAHTNIYFSIVVPGRS